jgi:predicted dienelactone hydrolase
MEERENTMRTRIVFSLLVFMLAVSCTVPLGPKTTPTPILPTLTPVFTPNASSSALSPYAADGPYSVASTAYADEEPDYIVYVFIWYPIVNGSSGTAQAPYPLVVYSPGLGGSPKEDESFIITSLASHGFVVISGAFLKETGSNMWIGAGARPRITQQMIGNAEKLTARGGELAGMIDMKHIAVVGISSGGWTALMGGGAQMDLGWCTAHKDLVAKLPISNCPQFVSHQQEIAAMLGLKSAPSGLWPQRFDKRVDAVIALSPDGDIWGKDYGGVAAMKVPTMIMAGSVDTINPPELCAYPIYDHLGSQNKGLFVVTGGDHGVSKDDYTLSVLRHMMVAFLLAHLKSDTNALKALAPTNVNFTDVQYKTTGFGTR